MARYRDISTAVVGEDVVEDFLASDVLIYIRFPIQRLPQSIFLTEASLDVVAWVREVDVFPITAAVARMPADALPEQLLHRRDERVRMREREASEGEVGSHETAAQRAGVVALRGGDFLILDLSCPEGVDGLGLRDAGGGEVRVRPGDGGVAVQERVVAVPGWGAEVAFRGVVEAFAVAAEVEELVLGVVRGVAVELGDEVGEALPLGSGMVGVFVVGVCGVGAVDEAEVGGEEVEGAGVCGGEVLEEVAADCGVVDVGDWW